MSSLMQSSSWQSTILMKADFALGLHCYWKYLWNLFAICFSVSFRTFILYHILSDWILLSCFVCFWRFYLPGKISLNWLKSQNFDVCREMVLQFRRKYQMLSYLPDSIPVFFWVLSLPPAYCVKLQFCFKVATKDTVDFEVSSYSEKIK